jgi:uracil-DNA glycosylase
MSHWTAAQHAMLREMGIQLWVPPEVPVVEAEPAAVEIPSAARPAEASGVRSADAMPVRREVRPSGLEAAEDVAPMPEPGVGRSPMHVPDDSVPPGVPTRARTVQPISVPVAAWAGPSSTMDWPALEAAVQACEACALSRSRRRTVFGVGHQQAEWMLVGEAPGEQEDLQGEPFVGKAGQLLDHMLRAVGLTRSEAPASQQVYIANVLKCRPPGNRNPDPEEVQRCQPYLQRQIELVQPRLILALGRFAVQALLGSAEPIGRLRGRIHHHQGVPVVVSYHPAYLLRNPLDKARAWEDLCLAAQVHRDAQRASPM